MRGREVWAIGSRWETVGKHIYPSDVYERIDHRPVGSFAFEDI